MTFPRTGVAIEWEAIDGSPVPPDVRIVDDGLDSFNLHASDVASSMKFACIARVSGGEVTGGAIARWWGRACEIQQLWVADAFRRGGNGRRIVELVEQHARARGCAMIYLDTFTFRAPRFYLRLGYEVACELKGFPNDVSKFIMRKQLEPPRAAAPLLGG